MSTPSDRPSLTGPAADPVGPLLSARGLADRRAAVVHFCLGPAASFIGVREPDAPATPLIEFLPLPTLGAELLSGIGSVDESARRLLRQFVDVVPATAARVEAFDAGLDTRTPVLGWLFGAVSLLLDLDEPDLADVERRRAPSLRLDTVVVPAGSRSALDGRRLLRSVLSYRLAGVPGHVLARSVVESLGEFAADAVRRLLREWPAQLVVCAGDLYARSDLLRGATSRGLTGIAIPVIMPEPEVG